MSKKVEDRFNSVIMTVRVPNNIYEAAKESAARAQMSLAEWVRHKFRNLIDAEKVTK